MRRPVARSLYRLLIASLLAALPQPAVAEGAQPAGADGAQSAGEATCEVPGAPAGTAPAKPAVDLGPSWARLAAEEPQARAEGYRALNTRGYNYAADARGLDQAALDFEAGGPRPTGR